MGSMRKGWRAAGTLAFVTAMLTGGAVLGSAPASQAATTSTAAVTAPGILAPPDVVVGAADGAVNLKVTLTAPGNSPVTVAYTTAAGTTSGNTACVGTSYGYVGQQGTLTFQPGVTSQTVRVPLLNCGTSLPLGFQEFSLNLYSNSSDSTIVRASTQIDITGDAPATSTPKLYVRDAVVDTKAGTIEVPVLLGGPSGAASGTTVTVPYSTQNGSAVAGTDYQAVSGTLTFPAGETAQNITVPILPRSGAVKARSFAVTLGTPVNAKVADGTGIVTIEASGGTAVSTPGISAPPATMVYRGDGYVDLPVTLSAPGNSPVTVAYTTAAGTTSGNTACVGTSYGYVGQQGTLTFQPGVTSQTVRVPLLNCSQTAKATFSLNLYSNSPDSTIVRAQTTITVVPTVTNPGAPRSVTAVAGSGAATVSFAPPASDGGNGINSYTVTASPGGATASGISSPITVTGLTNGTTYTFTVTATNAHGTGPASLPSNPVTPH
jgi:Calx-beta domain-containing protein/fibronectin type III domain protein